MSDNVVVLNVDTKLDLPPERILTAAIEQNLDEAVVIGHKDGKLYMAAGPADLAHVYLMLACALKEVMGQAYD
jgi:hypothetical protein